MSSLTPYHRHIISMILLLWWSCPVSCVYHVISLNDWSGLSGVATASVITMMLWDSSFPAQSAPGMISPLRLPRPHHLATLASSSRRCQAYNKFPSTPVFFHFFSLHLLRCADDTELYRSVVPTHFASLVTDIQSCISDVKEWTFHNINKLQVQLNKDNTEALLLTPSKSSDLSPLKVGQNDIHFSD